MPTMAPMDRPLPEPPLEEEGLAVPLTPLFVVWFPIGAFVGPKGAVEGGLVVVGAGEDVGRGLGRGLGLGVLLGLGLGLSS